MDVLQAMALRNLGKMRQEITYTYVRINNQQDASRIQNFYFVTKLYIFRASTVPIIRSYQLHTWQLVCFMQVMWSLPRRVRFQPDSPR
jgi:hypothetical protein